MIATVLVILGTVAIVRPLEAAISEYSAGQVELTLHHGPDALRAGDEAQMYKRLARGLAAGGARPE